MKQVFTTTVYVGDCSPYVNVTERAVSATLEDGSLVVTQVNHKPLVVQAGEYSLTREDAAYQAIVRLEQLRDRNVAEFDKAIEKVRKTYLQAQTAAV